MALNIWKLYKYVDELLQYLKGVMKVQIMIIHLNWMIKSIIFKGLTKKEGKRVDSEGNYVILFTLFELHLWAWCWEELSMSVSGEGCEGGGRCYGGLCYIYFKQCSWSTWCCFNS